MRCHTNLLLYMMGAKSAISDQTTSAGVTAAAARKGGDFIIG